LYFLNGVRCRRRDITDLFLGTGLGPRSYSIIEQGMISRIIEARPEELRVYLEEAAGISKYKERRRETENRMAHTRENLERLDDLREEVQKQLRHLERQAATAQKYKSLREEERRAKAELLVLRLGKLLSDIEQRDRRIAEQQNRLEQALSDQRKVEADIEQRRAAHAESNDDFNEVQARFYAIGADIARLEESIQYAREARRRREDDLEQARKALAQAQALSTQDSSRLAELSTRLEKDQPMLDQARAVLDRESAALQTAESAMQQWQTDWDTFNDQANAPAQQAQVERTRINHLEQQEAMLKRRLVRLEEEQRQLSDISLDAEIAELTAREAEAQGMVRAARENLDSQVGRISALRGQTAQTQEKLAASRSELETLRGRLASLQALQQAAREAESEGLEAWLADSGLGDRPRALEALQVAPEWQSAVEAVLGDRLQSVLVPQFNETAGALPQLDSGHLTLVDAAAESVVQRPDSLGSVVTGPAALVGMLNAVLLAADLPDAMARRTRLGPGESLVTPDGIWVGPDWVSVRKGSEATRGLLAREQEVRELMLRRQDLEPEVEQLVGALAADRQALVEVEQSREAEQKALDAAQNALSDLSARLSGKQARAEQIRHRVEGLERDAEELRQQIADGAQEMDEARRRLHESLAAIEDLSRQREALVSRRDALRGELDAARSAAGAARNAMHEIALRVESMRSSEDSLRSGIGRMQSQLGELEQRCGTLQSAIADAEAPLAEQQQRLETQLQDRSAVEKSLSEARSALEAIDQALRELEQARHTSEENVQTARSRLDQVRMDRQEVVVRSRTLEEQLAESGFERALLESEMPAEAEVTGWQSRVETLESRIQRLGPINLAAIDEFKEQGERMAYLDRQHEDVSKSLSTLEEAIRKIDRETRTRFKETFDRVDGGFKELFPKLFGGGHAYLEMTGEDLLDTGVTVMARPPGKRNTSIHLLSGGEKALTAVALVFAIFRLNPAPFCMLDEVDAPLDDANVGRYSALVKDMSEHVQFIFITHNKVTMEIANQLSGVTMHEPGVSRLVTVDVEEAAALAAI
ncbi:MAG: chromosome segregation protein SMC, partial [Chromatiaceae bacterium]